MFFSQKKDQNVRFPAKFQEKANIIERQFSQNVTVIYARYSAFYVTGFWSKRTKREISGRFSGKAPCNRATNFPKRNNFI